MRVTDGVKLVATCILLCAGCREEDPLDMYTGNRDDGATPADAATASDAGPVDAASSTADSGNADGGNADAGTSEAGASAVIAQSAGSWMVYPDPYADGGANPAMGIQGSAMAVRAGDAGMTVTLNVSGLPGMRGFGSHVHKLECQMMAAGGHYQHMPAPDGGATDPAFANPTNEVWLDFTTNDAGMGMATATVDFVPPAGGAKAIIVHDKLTGDGGVAGPKLACLPFAF